MINALILDLDGPILDGRERHYRCYADILVKYGFEPMPISDYWKMKRKRSSRLDQLSRSGAERIHDQFVARWIDRIETRKYLELDRLQPGVAEKLSQWKASGLKLLLVTMRNNKQNLSWQLTNFELADFFDQVVAVGSSDPSESKSLAARAFVHSHGAGSVTWLGDTEVDIEAAKKLGVPVCGVCCGLRNRAFLEGLEPDMVLPSLSEFHV